METTFYVCHLDPNGVECVEELQDDDDGPIIEEQAVVLATSFPKAIYFAVGPTSEPVPVITYETTHVSSNDGSTVMCLGRVGNYLILMNEDGVAWSNPNDGYWEPV